MKFSDPQVVDMGTFKVASSTLLITDPCYAEAQPPRRGATSGSRGLQWFHLNHTQVKPGTWVAHVLKVRMAGGGEPCAALWAHHIDHPLHPPDPRWRAIRGTGVDSGQAGFFDPARFDDDSVVTEWIARPLRPENLWYSLCCERTLKPPRAGVIPFGCVSSSGLGDGSYPAFEVLETTGAVAVGLDFQLVKQLFTPHLTSDERELYDRLRAGDLSTLASSAHLLTTPFFVQYATYHGHDDALVTMLELLADRRPQVDVSNIVAQGNVALLRRVFPHISTILDDYAVLRSLASVPDLALALQLSEVLEDHLDPNPEPDDSWEPPAIFVLARHLPEGHEPLLQFWLDHGLDASATDSRGKTILEQPGLSPAVQALIRSHLSPS